MAKDNNKKGQEDLIKEQLEALTRLQNNLQQIFTSDVLTMNEEPANPTLEQLKADLLAKQQEINDLNDKIAALEGKEPTLEQLKVQLEEKNQEIIALQARIKELEDGNIGTDCKKFEDEIIVLKARINFNFVENSWWSKKNHQYDNFKRKLYKFLILLVNFFIR